jgi:hypothetical protein
MGNRRSRSGVGCQPLSKRTATCFMRPLRAEAQAHRGQTATKLKSRYGSTIESLPELSGGPRLDETQADFRLLASSHTPLKKSIILVSAVSYEDDSRRVVNDFHSEGSPVEWTRHRYMRSREWIIGSHPIGWSTSIASASTKYQPAR